MRLRTWATLTLFVLIAVSGSCRDQDDPSAARYGVAIRWINWINAGEFEKAAGRLDPAAIIWGGNAALLEQAWAKAAARAGALISLEPKRQEMRGSYHVVILTSVFANGTFDLEVIMAHDHRVAGFFVEPPS